MLLSPVAEVTRYDKQGVGVIKVRRKYFAVVIGHFFIDWPSEDGYDFGVLPKRLYNERQVHFNAMLILLVVNVQHEEPLLLLEPVHHLHVDFQGPKGSVVLVHVCKRASREIFVMGGAEDEDSFDIVGTGDVLVGPPGSGSTEVESCMRANQSLDLPLPLLPPGVVDVLSQFSIEFGS